MNKLKTVFLSSTFKDLVDERKALTELIAENFTSLRLIGMESFGARTERPSQVCESEVTQADIYIGVINDHYGSIESISGKSFTELEYRNFKGEVSLIFLRSGVDYTKKSSPFKKFVDDLTDNHTPDYWGNGAELVAKVAKAIKRELYCGEVETGLPPDKYSVHVMGEKSFETRVVQYSNTQEVAIRPNSRDHIIQWCSFVSHTRPFSCTFDFTKGTLPPGFEFSRPSLSFGECSDTGSQLEVPVDTPYFKKLSELSFGIRLEPQRVNFLHKFTYDLRRQAVTLNKGEYTLWMLGSGFMNVKGAFKASVNSRHDLSFCVNVSEPCTLVIEAFGQIRHAQLEDGSERTSVIKTVNTQVCRVRELLFKKQS